jgi:predicted NAD/FAD-binding protein
MFLGILKFNATAIEVLDPGYKYKNETIAQYVSRNQYPLAFRRLYLYPLLSCIWIHDPNEDVGAMPIIFVVQYLWNHRLLHTFTSPVIWQTIDGGARQYVSRILDKIYSAFVHRKSTVDKIIRRHDHMTLRLTDGQGRPLEEDFEHVIFATHPEEILRILGGEATEQEREVLKMFHMTAESEVVLHSDQTVGFNPVNLFLQY